MNTSGRKILYLQRNCNFGHRLTTVQLLKYMPVIDILTSSVRS